MYSAFANGIGGLFRRIIQKCLKVDVYFVSDANVVTIQNTFGVMELTKLKAASVS